jgi:hypothetical protein
VFRRAGLWWKTMWGAWQADVPLWLPGVRWFR